MSFFNSFVYLPNSGTMVVFKGVKGKKNNKF